MSDSPEPPTFADLNHDLAAQLDALMSQIDVFLAMHPGHTLAVADHLLSRAPHRLSWGILERLTPGWFDGPAGTGYMLYKQQTAHRWLGHESQVVTFASMLAGNVHVTTANLAEVSDYPAAQGELFGRVYISWSMLKGIIIAACEDPEADLVPMICRDSPRIDLIVDALRTGLQTCQTYGDHVPGGNDWPGSRFNDVHTEGLISRFLHLTAERARQPRRNET